MQQLPNILDLILDENPTAQDLITIILALAVFWTIVFAEAICVISSVVKDKPWFRKASDNDYERSAKVLLQKMGITQTIDEYFELFKYQWPWLQCLCFQHFIGGILCLPSILGLLEDQATASSLACLGILSEMGWELSDMLMWMYKRYFTENGKIKVPGALLVALAIHHSLSTLLGIPAILNYRNLKTLHMICFELQAASAVALFVQEYTKLLDVSVPRQLRLFQVMTGFALVVMIFCRLIHWPFLVADIAMIMYEQKAWIFMAVGMSIALVFTIFSWSLCIQPCYARFCKFLKMSAKYESIPVDKRRSSAIALQAAAADIFAPQQQSSLPEELASIFVQRQKVNRRETVPPSLGRRHQKRTSLVLLRASIGDFSSTLCRIDAPSIGKKG